MRPILRRISVIESVRLPRSCILTILTRPATIAYAKNTFSLRVFKVSCDFCATHHGDQIVRQKVAIHINDNAPDAGDPEIWDNG